MTNSELVDVNVELDLFSSNWVENEPFHIPNLPFMDAFTPNLDRETRSNVELPDKEASVE
jgi:hypothetical protein